MASIGASTIHKMKIKPKTSTTKKRTTTTTATKKKGTIASTPASRRGSAPTLTPKLYTSEEQITSFFETSKSKEEQGVEVQNLLLNVFGEDSIFHEKKNRQAA